MTRWQRVGADPVKVVATGLAGPDRGLELLDGGHVNDRLLSASADSENVGSTGRRMLGPDRSRPGGGVH